MIVYGSANPLLAPQIAFGRLYGNLTEEKLNLLQFSTGSVAQFRARAPQIVRGKLVLSEFIRVQFHNLPNYAL